MASDPKGRARELASMHPEIVLGSQVEAKVIRCDRCLRMFAPGEVYEGKCGECTEAAKEEVSQATLRRQVFERDKGFCAECHMDTEALRSELAALRSVGGLESMKMFSARVHFFARLGFPKKALEGGETLWNCDHKLEKAAGGSSTPDQCQSLCLRCHKAKTGGFASKRAGARKPKGRGFNR